MVSVRFQVALAKNVLRCSASQSCIISIRMKPVSYTITATAHATSQIKFSGLRLTVEFVKATALAPGTLPDLDYVVLDFELGRDAAQVVLPSTAIIMDSVGKKSSVVSQCTKVYSDNGLNIRLFNTTGKQMGGTLILIGQLGPIVL